MPTAGLTIRAARPEEAELLSALVLRSKAHWGYDADFMEKSREPLRVRPEVIRGGHVFLAVDPHDRPLGIAAVSVTQGAAELDLLFVDPDAMGRGAGRALYQHAIHIAAAAGAKTLWILADPYAVPFYQAMGAAIVGEEPSDAIPGRMLPRMRAVITD